MFQQINIIDILVQMALQQDEDEFAFGFTDEHIERIAWYKENYSELVNAKIIDGAVTRFKARTDGVSYADTLLEDYRQFDALLNGEE